MSVTDEAKAKAGATYNAAADSYDAGFWDSHSRHTARRFGLRRSASVLDVACGTGAAELSAAESVAPEGRVVAAEGLGDESAERVKRDNVDWARRNAIDSIATNVVYAGGHQVTDFCGCRWQRIDYPSTTPRRHGSPFSYPVPINGRRHEAESGR